MRSQVESLLGSGYKPVVGSPLDRHPDLVSTRIRSHPSQGVQRDFMEHALYDFQQRKASARNLHENHLEDSSIKKSIINEFEMSSTLRIETCNTRNSTELATNTPLPNSTSTILLQTVRSTETSEMPLGNDQDTTLNVSSLAPVDKVIVWGFPNAFGVFLDAYLRDPTYSAQPRAYFLLPLIGTLTTAIMYFSGLANGVINAGTPLSGLVLPLILPGLIEKHGTEKTLRILAIVFFRRFGTIAAIYARPAASDLVRRSHFRPLDEADGFSLAFATAMNLSPSKAALSLAMLNGKYSLCAEVIARLLAGILSDRVDPWLLAFFTLLGACIATFILWGVLSHSLAGLIAFGLLSHRIDEDPMLSTNILSYLMLSRGLGNILSTPISTALSSQHNGRHRHERFGFDVGG
ncbi:9719_t:CDS:2, partial [Acaulospora colombiana]